MDGRQYRVLQESQLLYSSHLKNVRDLEAVKRTLPINQELVERHQREYDRIIEYATDFFILYSDILIEDAISNIRAQDTDKVLPAPV